MANLVEYGGYSAEAAQAARKNIDDAGGGEFLKLKEGRTRLRIPPPPKGVESPFFEVWKHFIKHNDQLAIVVCPRLTDKAGNHCPICEAVKEARNSGNPLDRDKGYKMRAQLRAMCYALDRGAPEKGLQIWDMTKAIYDTLVEIRTDADFPCDFTDPMKGYDLHIDRDDSGQFTEYKVQLARRPSPLFGEENKPDISKMNELILAQEDLGDRKRLPSDADLLSALEGRKERETRPRLPESSGSRGGRGDAPRGKVIDAKGEDGDDADDFPQGM